MLECVTLLVINSPLKPFTILSARIVMDGGQSETGNPRIPCFALIVDY